jgi:acetyl esterase/lipase
MKPRSPNDGQVQNNKLPVTRCSPPHPPRPHLPHISPTTTTSNHSTTTMSVSLSDVASSFRNLVSTGAVWQPHQDGDLVRVLSGVSYADESPFQSLDLFLPSDYVSPILDTEETDEDVVDGSISSSSSVQERPVYVFIHGGGWSRGGKDNRFYGAPSMCKNMAASYGAISVSIGYRLGNYPDFMHDAAHGIRWVQDNILGLGGDVRQVFLSGHSAGAHIASLLMLRFDRFLAPLSIRRDFFRGIALLSGVYDLFCPMKKSLVDTKNKAFVLAYVLPAFGYDEQLRRDASPLLLLHPEKDTSLLGTGPLALLQRISSSNHILKRLSSLPSDLSNALKPDDWQNEEKDRENEEKDGESEEKEDIMEAPKPDGNEHEESSPADESPLRTDLPPTLILNAWFDMGLEENGKLMAEAMKEHGIDATHVTIPKTEHASICWSQKTIDVVSAFFKNTTKSPEEEEEEETPRTCEPEEAQP